MPDLPIYEIKLPAKVGDMLKVMVAMSQKYQAITLTYNRSGPDVRGSATFTINCGGEHKELDNIEAEAIYGLDALRLLVSESKEYAPLGTSSGVLFLTKLAHQWVNYHSRNPFYQWAYRIWDKSKFVFLIIVPALVSVIVTLLTISLYYLQIIQTLKALGVI